MFQDYAKTEIPAIITFQAQIGWTDSDMGQSVSEDFEVLPASLEEILEVQAHCLVFSNPI